MRRRRNTIAEPPAWGRRKLLVLLVGVALAAVLVLCGLGWSVYYTLEPDGAPASGMRAGASVAAGPRERLAERAMPSAPAEAARPGPLTTEPFGSLRLPSARRVGAVGVSTGFPQTKEGALAQLIAIDQAALQSASVPGAQRVITAWALPGGPTAATWSGVKAIASMLAAAGLAASGSPSLTVTATAEMGLIKGTVGSTYVVACVDFVVAATVTATARVAAADCQRMVWSAGRWLIGPGSEPAQPPSVWPGSAAAHAAGYRELLHE